jgi:hypothetical protein
MGRMKERFIAEQERRALEGIGMPDDASWRAGLAALRADALAARDPERSPGHDYATDREYREHVEATTVPAVAARNTPEELP